MTAFRNAYDQALNALNQAGSPFEIGNTIINGQPYLSFVNAPSTLPELLAPARSYGDQEFVVYQQQRLTFDQLMQQADALAWQLQNTIQIEPGQRVAIAMRNNPQWLIAYVAIAHVGAVIVPLNSWNKQIEMHENLQDANVDLVICDVQRWQTISPKTLNLPAIVYGEETFQTDADTYAFDTLVNTAQGKSATAVNINGDDIAMIMFTSGTSGRAKGATFTHFACCQAMANLDCVGAIAFMTNSARYERSMATGLPPKALLTVPLFHNAGLYSQFLSCLRGGRGLVLMHKWDPAEACKLIARENISSIMGAPSMMMSLANCPEFMAIDRSQLVNISGAGAATPAVLSERLRDTVPDALRGIGWGFTESGGSGSAVTGYQGDDTGRHFLSCKPASSGFVSPVVDLQSVGPDGAILTPGETGELWIKSPANMLGYCNADIPAPPPGLEGYLNTGDIGYVDEDNCVYICDRAKDMIVRGGENIYPAQIEHCLLRLEGVEQVAVLGLPCTSMGEQVAAIIYPQADAALNADKIKAHCREHLADFKTPSVVRFADEPFPMNATHKVLKRELQTRYFSDF